MEAGREAGLARNTLWAWSASIAALMVLFDPLTSAAQGQRRLRGDRHHQGLARGSCPGPWRGNNGGGLWLSREQDEPVR